MLLELTDIIHDTKNREFYYEMPDGTRCSLKYKRSDSITIDIKEFNVPDALRKSGTIEQLNRALRKYADENHLRIGPYI